MPNETITEAEARERERWAFEYGAAWQRNTVTGGGVDVVLLTAKEAERRYPPPRRPRVVRDPSTDACTYRVGSDRLTIWRNDSAEGGWRVSYDEATPERVRVWADLFANPDEDA